jgi:DNA-binding transcriptional LysR family regulator
VKLEDHLDKLRAFKVIAEARTMHEAAKKLHLTQPALTKTIQNLEAALGKNLLSRGRHGVQPTEAGKILLDFATATLKNLEDLEYRIAHPSEQLAGHIRIGAFASLAEYLWPNFIPAFRKEAPALRLSVFTSDPIDHVRSLEREDIDILVDAEPRLSDQLISWDLYSDRFNFYMRGHTVKSLNPETIGDLPLIYSPGAYDQDGKKIAQHLEENGYFFKERIELDSFMAVLAFAKKGLGLAVLPNRLAEVSVTASQIHSVQLKGFAAKGFGTHNFSATILEKRKDDPRLRFLIQTLKRWFKET